MLVSKNQNNHIETTGEKIKFTTIVFPFAFLLTVVFLLPNLFLISTDDMSFSNHVIRTGYFNDNQGADGRYTFSFAIKIINMLSLNIETYDIVSILLFCYAITYLFFTVIDCLKIEGQKNIIFGFVIFLTFGLSLDMYQYIFAYLPYGVAMMCVAGAFSAATGGRGFGVRLCVCALLAFVGFGAYQVTEFCSSCRPAYWLWFPG